MRTYWSDTRPNGQPIEPGTFCYVSDLEDGTNPIYTYGKTVDEVLAKVARNNLNAQQALLQRTPAPPPAPGNAPAAMPAARKRLSADEVMQATTDLSNPAKAGEAVSRLVQDATGIDLNKLTVQGFKEMAMRWQQAHPEFLNTKGNAMLVTDRAKAFVGGDLASVTEEHMTRAFQVLQQGGYLQERGDEPPLEDEPQNNLRTFPVESQVQRTERPRGGRFATGMRSTAFRGGAQRPGQPATLKYTEEQILKMPTAQSRQLIESNDPDYARACEVYFGESATA